MPSDLLPCPWCQRPARLTIIKDSLINPELVGCDNDACPLSYSVAMVPDEWNRREPATAPAGEVLVSRDALATMVYEMVIAGRSAKEISLFIRALPAHGKEKK